MTSVFNHPWHSGLFGDVAIADILDAEADLQRMTDIEIAWLEAQAEVGTCAPDLAARAINHIVAMTVDLADLRAGCAADGLPVPRFVQCLKVDAPDDIKAVIHTGLTSQDVMDTSLMLAMQDIFAVYQKRISDLCKALSRLHDAHGQNTLTGYTRMQAALPITAGRRIQTWTQPFAGYATQLDILAERLRVVQFGGPVGLRDGEATDAAGAAFANRLGLNDPGSAWHTTRQDLAALAALVAQITGTLGKMGQDIALMAQRGADDIVLKGGGRSSAMPHKTNPIRAELLVTLAHYSATSQLSMTTAMVHEQERSGAMWALEWMVLPDLLQACGRSLSAAIELLQQVDQIGVPAAQNLT